MFANSHAFVNGFVKSVPPLGCIYAYNISFGLLIVALTN